MLNLKFIILFIIFTVYRQYSYDILNNLSLFIVTSLFLQIAYRIFEVELPEGWREKPVAECAVLIQIYHLRLSGQIQLEALRKTLTVFVQVNFMVFN